MPPGEQQEKVVLALRMLRMYNFDLISLGEFVRDAITNFIDDESPTIRREAALTCCKLVSP